MANQIEKMTVSGEVKGRDVVLVDDMCDTAGTLTKAADMMMEQGATASRHLHTYRCSVATRASASSAARSPRSSLPIPFHQRRKMAQTTRSNKLSWPRFLRQRHQRMRAHEASAAAIIA